MNLLKFFKVKLKNRSCDYYVLDEGIKIPFSLKELYDLSPSLAKQYVIYDIPLDTLYMLVNSLKSDRKIEENIGYMYSQDTRLPYICETEYEYDRLRDDCSGVLGVLSENVEGIISTVLMYRYGETENPDKKDYWKQQLVSLATNGNRLAQAALSSSNTRALTDFQESEWKSFEGLYLKRLFDDCEKGDPYALIGIALYHNEGDINKKIALLKKAASNKITDAYYYLGKAIETKYYLEIKECKRELDCDSQKYKEMRHRQLNCYRLGALCNNGIMSGYCQYRLSSMYENGEMVEKDINNAIYWCEMAAQNGHKYSEEHLKWLKN